MMGSSALILMLRSIGDLCAIALKGRAEFDEIVPVFSPLAMDAQWAWAIWTTKVKEIAKNASSDGSGHPQKRQRIRPEK